MLAPNGDLERGAAEWKLTGGAKVVDGNETFYVGGAKATRSRSTSPPGARRRRGRCASSSSTRPSATSPRTARTPVLSSLLVEALIENPLTGGVLTLPAGVHTGGTSWHPSLPGLVVADFLSVLGEDGKLAVAFRFKPIGLGAKWQIDDVYVDPFRNR